MFEILKLDATAFAVSGFRAFVSLGEFESVGALTLSKKAGARFRYSRGAHIALLSAMAPVNPARGDDLRVGQTL